MTVMGLEQVSSQSSQVGTTKKDVMGKDDFLRLLVTQLQAQDPLNPMDANDFTAQLAQFSSLEQLQNINSSLGGIGTSQSVLTNSQAVDYIGKQITAVGDRIKVADGQSSALQFSLDADAAAVYAKIYDANGGFVRNVECGSMKSGINTATWNGRDYLDGAVPDGNYSFQIMAMDSAGNSVKATTLTQGTVSGINFKDGQAYLLTDGQEILLGNVYKVQDAAAQ